MVLIISKHSNTKSSWLQGWSTQNIHVFVHARALKQRNTCSTSVFHFSCKNSKSCQYLSSSEMFCYRHVGNIKKYMEYSLTCVCAHHVLPVRVWSLVQKHVSLLWVSQCEEWEHPLIPGQSACAWNCPAGRRRPRNIKWWRHWEWGGGWTSLRASA